MYFRVFRFNFYYLRGLLLFFVIFSCVLLYQANIGGYYTIGHCDVATNISKNITLSYEKQNLDTERIARFIQLINKEEKITNVDAYGAITEDTIILVILVDKISYRWNLVISSLANVRGIEEALIVFSHSYLDEEINSAINSIDFCRVWQIFYPYSIQTHPNVFPGDECSGESSCLNSNSSGNLFRDVHGRLRNPKRAENKHHWWWTANNIFENFSSTLRHTGLVIFSDDSFVFMKDFIYMVSYMRNVAKSQPQCEILSLGSDITPVVARKIELQDTYSVQLTTWNLKEHSRMLAFDMSVWNSIVSHYDVFCILDDASWLRSLYFISVNRVDGKGFKALSAVTPRAYKVDACAPAYFFSPPCNLSDNVKIITEIEKMNNEKWFPPYLELYIHVELDDDDDVIFDYSEGEGGWADPRDWALCRNMTAGKIKKILMEMKNEFHEYFGGKS